MDKIQKIQINETLVHEEKIIAERLLNTRIKLGISRYNLARTVGIDESELVKYENAIEAIPASTLLMISVAMGLDFEYFYYDNIMVEGFMSDSISHHQITEERPALLS